MGMEQTRLEGFGLTLEPAELHHSAGLSRVATSDHFRYFLVGIPTECDEEGLRFHLETLRNSGAVPYVMMVEGEPVGVTCYLDVRSGHRGLEIGCTWIAKHLQGTFVNPAAKFLLLQHAFETLNFERVQLKCDARNLHSQRAIAKLGAQREGVLRKHMRLPDGYQRDTVMFSIVAEEWPTVRKGLLTRLSTK